jgi:hypothetical protein
MLRRLIRWLARKEIAEAFVKGMRHGEIGADAREKCAEMEGTLKATLAEQKGRLEGYIEGRDAAFDHIEETVRERLAGIVTEEDLAKAKKRGLH